MLPQGPAIREGHYARKQLFSRSWLINWSHGSRFQAGVEVVRRIAGQRVLDYGCGDGTFLAILMHEPNCPAAAAVGAEIAQPLVDDCRTRLAGLPGLSFVTVADLAAPEHTGQFDTLVCMEVMEHVPEWEPIFSLWDRLLRPGGKVLISVPVETGPPLLVKQVARRVAGWRGIGHYPGQTPYTWREFFRSLFAGSRQHIPRPVHRAGDGPPFHCHKGFNWKVFRTALAAHFQIEQTFATPLRFLPAGMGSQVWFVAAKAGLRLTGSDAPETRHE